MVDDAKSVMTSISRRCTHGKGFEDLQKAGREKNERVLRPKLWSETRFSAHAAGTIKVFLANLGAATHLLEEKLEKEGTDAATRADLAHMKGKPESRLPQTDGYFHSVNASYLV
ncbi:MAG: hypothetical protein AAGB19_18275 [Cyanobacteria bacterium P01_F01_bin.3]